MPQHFSFIHTHTDNTLTPAPLFLTILIFYTPCFFTNLAVDTRTACTYYISY